MNSTRGAQSTKTALLDLFVPPEPEPKTAPNNGSGSPFEPGESSTASASKATGCVSPPLAPPLSPIHHRPSLVQRCRSDRSELAQPSTFDKIIDRDDDNNGTHSDTNTELTPLLTRKSALHPTSPVSISSTVLDGSVTPKTGSASRQKSPRGIERPIGILTGVTHCLPDLLPIQELAPSTENSTKKSSLGGFRNHAKGVSHKLTNSLSELHTMASNAVRYAAVESVSPSTWIGAFMFLLFSLVFSLTFGATIIRPHGSFPLIGIVSRMSALGIMFGAPIYWLQLPDAPALYPTVDLFAAPFLAKIAVLVDEELFRDPTVSDSNNDRVFMATFAFLASLSLALSGSLSMLASIFKVVNLGAFLPFPVLCGFFTAAGCLTWTLAFKVDTNGLSVQQVFLSGDKSLMWMSLVHHTPSVVVAAVMKYMGPKHPLYVVMSVLITIAMFYAIMFSSGTTMEEMILHNWFWSKSESHFKATSEQARFQWSWIADWSAPSPFGWIAALLHGDVHWGAVLKSLETTVALSFLYLIRCSLHGTALKKNAAMLSRVEKVKIDPTAVKPTVISSGHRRKFSEIIDVESVQAECRSSIHDCQVSKVVSPKPMHYTLKHILLQYGLTQFVCSFVGGFGIIPCVAAAPTMFMLGAEKLAPQVGSVLLISIFYFTDYQLAGFIPKPAFSSLLVLSFLDVIYTWFIQSYYKCEEKLEWLVVPLIVVLAFVVGLLQAVLLGLAISTFLFVASFFRSGVVKFAASGASVRSTIERSPIVSLWLDQNAEQIQILVMQNFLFFGNASLLNSYVVGMFADAAYDLDPLLEAPSPKIIIVDLALVTGMDTSAVDVFSDILSTCVKNDCKLFMSGVSPRVQKVMYLCGVRPDSILCRSQRRLRFFSCLDAALGKAEDLLIQLGGFEEDIYDAGVVDGFLRSLNQIDMQHNIAFSNDLHALQAYTRPVLLNPGDCLHEKNDGLFFIEQGILKIERCAEATISRAGSEIIHRRSNVESVAGIRVDEWVGLSHFRVARVGPGWVIGSLEGLTGDTNSETIVAVTQCTLHYISQSYVDALETKAPTLALKLYKLMSYLLTKRQQLTISQMGTLQSIMSSPALRKPIGRSRLHSFYG